MENRRTPKSLCEFIWEIEKKHHLFDWRLDDVEIWNYLRMSIYYELANKIGMFEEQAVKTNINSTSSKLIKLTHFVFRAFGELIFRPRYKIDVCVVEHERPATLPNGEVGDIYTFDYRAIAGEKGKKIVSLRWPNPFEKNKSDSTNPAVILGIEFLLTPILEKFIKVKLTSKDINIIEKIEADIFNAFNIDYQLTHYFKKYVARFKIRSFLFKRILKVLKPKKMVIVVPYARKAEFVQVAHDLKINVVEFQHGIISKYHLGYSYPNDIQHSNLLPDKLSLWSDNWNLGAVLPSRYLTPDIKCIYPFKKDRSEIDSWQIDPNKITFISQGALTNEIANFLLSHYEAFKNYEIHYKLHPSEFGRVNEFKSLHQVNTLPNVTIVGRCDLHQLMGTSVYVVGVFSTALIEAKDLLTQTQVVILDLPGSEYFEGSKGYLSFDNYCSQIGLAKSSIRV